MKKLYLSLGGAVLLLILLAIWLKPGLVRFWPFSATEFAQQFGPLILIALFIERALEVFLTPLRGGESDEKTEELKKKKELIEKKETAQATILEDERNDVKQKTLELTKYKAGTRQIAFVAALVLGILVSALGVRGLGLFVDPAAFADLSAVQRNLFNAVDVLLTGALLGGGADGLHKLVSVFTGYMDAAAKNAKARA